MNNLSASLIKKEPIGTQAIQLTLKLSDSSKFEFKPGQYIWLVLPKLDFPDPRGERRAFSVTSSSSEKNQITILVRVSESGFKKTLFNLPQNSPLQIIGPFGNSYVINSELDKKIVLIAGGVAIAPFSSTLRSLQSFSIMPKLQMVYCSSSVETSCFTPDLDQICTQNGISVTKHLGDFRENILPVGVDFVNDEFFVCGPEEFVNSVCTLLFSKNVPLSRIHLEQFYPAPVGNLTEADFILKPGERNIMLQAVQDSKNHVIVTDANGKIIFANEIAKKNTGFTFDEMRGNTPRLWGGLMSAEFYQNFWLTKHQAGGFDGILTNRRKSNQIYQVIAHISPIYGENKIIIGYIGTEEDITDRLNLEQQLKIQNADLVHEKQQEEAILNSIGDGLIVTDNRGIVRMINPSAVKMLNKNAQSFLGEPIFDAIPMEDENNEFIPAIKRSLNIALSGVSSDTTTLTTTTTTTDTIKTATVFFIRDDKIKFPVSATTTTIYLDNGYIGGAVIVFRDITHEKEVDKAKTEFISLASHQLRTPLSTINWYTESILSGETGEINPNQKQFLDEIYTASKRMVTLVNSLLNVSRIELGTFMIEPVITDLVSLLQSEITELNVQSEIKKIRVNYIKNVDKLEILIDIKLMQMVLQNIIANAIKYSPENSQIEIALTKSDQEIAIVVKDQGIGIPSSEQGKIFSKLFRAANAKAKISDGNGLGLYLAKMIMDQSGGKLWFESEENKGTAFHIILPVTGMIKKEGSKALS